MNDKELVDRLVALGVVDIMPEGPEDDFQYLTPGGDLWRSTDGVLEDWSVTGALMEECLRVCTAWDEIEPDCWTFMNRAPSLPKAITEICVAVLDRHAQKESK